MADVLDSQPGIGVLLSQGEVVQRRRAQNHRAKKGICPDDAISRHRRGKRGGIGKTAGAECCACEARA